MTAVAWAVLVGLSLTGLALLAIGLRGDPARGRRRCPKCWYDMGGAALAAALKCPECGRAIRAERDLLRTRRGKRQIGWGAVLIVLGLAIHPTARFAAKGWPSLPRPVVFIAARVLDLDAGRGGDRQRSLWAAMELAVSDRVPAWQQALMRSALAARLADSEAWDRSAAVAIGAVAWHAGNDVEALMPAMAALLTDPEPQVRYAAAVSMYNVRRGDPTLTSHWKALTDRDVRGSAALVAVTALGEIVDRGHHEAATVLVGIADRTEGQIQTRALMEAGPAGDPMVAFRLGLKLRAEAGPSLDLLLAFPSMGEHLAPAVPMLLELLEDPRFHAGHVVRALGAARSGAVLAGPALVSFTSDIENPACVEAIRALGLIGSPPPGAVAPVREHLMRYGGFDGAVALECLFRWGWEPDPEALERIRKMAAGKGAGRAWAGLYLARLECREAEVIPELVRLVDSEDLWEAVSAIRALDALGPAAASAVPALERLVRRDPGGQSVEKMLADEARIALRRIDPSWKEPRRGPR